MCIRDSIDTLGKTIEPPKYSEIGGCYNNTLTIKVKEQWGVWENGIEDFDHPELYFKKPENSPLFSAECVALETEEERKKYSEKASLMQLYRNIKYPPYARENGVQGSVVIQFIINTKGDVEDVQVAKSIGGGCDQEALRVVREKLMKWHQPGRQDGMAVNTIFYLPIRYRLE